MAGVSLSSAVTAYSASTTAAPATASVRVRVRTAGVPARSDSHAAASTDVLSATGNQIALFHTTGTPSHS